MTTRNARALARAMTLAAGLTLAWAACAQSTSAGITGRGEFGDIAVVQNVDTGTTREIRIPKNGRYQVRNLPIGTYIVVLKHADGSSEPARQVTLVGGLTARVQ